MKSIDEAANEHSCRKDNESESYIGFKSGVEFAQQWIKVEEEKPKADDFSVNIEMKLDNNVVLSGYLFADGDWMAYDEDGCGIKIKRKVTSWRPIEFK